MTDIVILPGIGDRVSCTGKPDGKRPTRGTDVSSRPTGIGLSLRTGSRRWTAQLAPLRSRRCSSLTAWHAFWLHTGSRLPRRRSQAPSSLPFRIRKARPSPSRPPVSPIRHRQIQVSLTRHRERERSIWHDRTCPRESEPVGKRHCGSGRAWPHQRGKRAWGLAAGKGIACGFRGQDHALIPTRFAGDGREGTATMTMPSRRRRRSRASSPTPHDAWPSRCRAACRYPSGRPSGRTRPARPHTSPS